MIRLVFRLAMAALSLATVLLLVGIGFLWFDGSRIVDRANAAGWFTPKPDKAPMTVFETTASKAMFGGTWDEKGLPCRTAARFWFNYTSKPDRRGLSISQVVARDISYEVEANQTLSSQTRQLSVSCLLDGRFSDAELLRIWLRRASFGEGLVGIDAASQAVFDKAPSLLNEAESAKLVALIYQPTLRAQPDQWDQRARVITQRAAAN
jgi:Transglycosylase